MLYYQALCDFHFPGVVPSVFGELLTKREFLRKGYQPFSDLFRIVEVSQRKTYHFFGTRRAMIDTGINIEDFESSYRMIRWN